MITVFFFYLCVFHSSLVKFTFWLTTYYILHTFVPPSCHKKKSKKKNVPLYFVCLKNHTTQIHSSLFHTIQTLLSFKPFPLSFALGVWTCWWQSGPVCCKWWVVKVCLVVGGGGEGGVGKGRRGQSEAYNYIMLCMYVMFSKRYPLSWATCLRFWENSRHLTTPPLVSPRNDIWETSSEIPYWWRVATQIWVVPLILIVPLEKFAFTALPKSR